MTDPQLVILLRQYYERLMAEIDRIQEQLPESMAVKHEVRNFLIPKGVEVRVEYPVLTNLREWARSIERSIEILEGSQPSQHWPWC